MNTSAILYLNLIMGGSVIFLIIVSILVFFITTGGVYHHERLEGQGSKVVPRFLMKWMFWLIDPTVKRLIKAKVSPNSLTIFSLLISLCAGVSFAFGNFQLAGWLIILTGIFDIFDGWVARETNSITQAGGFLDSSIDRFAEIFMFGGLFWYYMGNPLMLFAIYLTVTGSLVFSYTRALGERRGVMTKSGFLQRHERFTVLSIAAILSPFASLIIEPAAAAPLYHIMAFAIIFLAVGINAGAIARAVNIYYRIVEKENNAAKDEKEKEEPLNEIQ